MKKVLLIVLPILIIIGGLLGACYYIYDNTINTNAIYKGIKIDGYEIGGNKRLEALAYIKEQKLLDDENKSMNLIYEDIEYSISLKELEYTYDYEKAIDEAFNLGRVGNLFERYFIIKELEKNGKNIYLQSDFNKNKVKEVVERISMDIDQESVDAQFDFNNGNINVSQDKTGILLKQDELIKLIEDNIIELEDLYIPVEETKPQLTKEFLSRINGVIGEFSTSFKGSSSGRIHNIKLSAESLSNLLIMPGEEISYNQTTGPRQAQLGYKEAPVILNGELTPGVGGGVCQTSTTLYNALLLADVAILERHPHSIAASYVPRGTDGAVATGYLDLRFKNDFDFPIYIRSKVVGEQVFFYIYGDTKAKDYKVIIEPVLVETIPYKVKEVYDETAAPGSRQMIQEGRTGYKVKTYKSIIKNGTVIERTQISSDYYRERDYIYRVGPQAQKKAEPVEPTIEEPNEVIEEIVEELLP